MLLKIKSVAIYNIKMGVVVIKKEKKYWQLHGELGALVYRWQECKLYRHYGKQPGNSSDLNIELLLTQQFYS